MAINRVCSNSSTTWIVRFSKKAEKQYLELPEPVQIKLRTLVLDIQISGPIRGNWKNYSKLGETQHHCHLKAGHPTYVVCWEVIDKQIRLVEVYYVGTHEKAPY
jgi:mRNA-degrading endonuclease RelE of RelBE toxin-antitoxin system